METYLISENSQIEINKSEHTEHSRLEVNANNVEVNLNTIELQRILMEMGFEVEIINKVFLYFQVNSLDRAIEYLTKNEDKWNHPFVNIENEELDKCVVCGELSSNHRLNFMKRSFYAIKLENSLSRFKSSPPGITNKFSFEPEEKNPDNDDICRICLSPIENEFKYKCPHKYCTDCIKDYIFNKINSSDVEEISCPEGKDKCTSLLEDDLIKSLIEGRDLERYLKFVHRAKIRKIPNAVMCPIPDCDSYDIFDKPYKDRNTFSLCVKNGHEFCAKCNQPAHPDVNCEHKLENDFKKWAGKEKVKKCPKCAFFIQKNEGCNHMTCANASCKYQFCWICMKEYNSRHFNNILYPCYGLQNINQRNLIVRYPFLRYLKMLLMLIAVIIAVAVGITFSPGILTYSYYKNTRMFQTINNLNSRFARNFVKLLVILFLIPSTLAFLPLGYLIMILLAIIVPIIMVIRCIRSR